MKAQNDKQDRKPEKRKSSPDLRLDPSFLQLQQHIEALKKEVNIIKMKAL